MKYALIRLPLVQHAGCLPRRVIFTVVLAVVITAAIAHPQEWSILHWFDSYPEGLPILPESQRLTYNGSILFGTTSLGGYVDCGVVFSIGTDGEDFKVVHLFKGGGADGRNPVGFLTLDPVGGSTLFGTTTRGGDLDGGVVFSVRTDGSDHALLHEFAGGADDGRDPRGSLTWHEGVLYGMTRHGGDADEGVVFSVRTDGSEYTVLHEFAGGMGDGRWPNGHVTVEDDVLYGMTEGGGLYDHGVVFTINTDGSDYSVLHGFEGGTNDGKRPFGSLVRSGSNLYGLTRNGGVYDRGTIFTIGTDGTGSALVRSFGGGQNDGTSPFGSLIVVDDSLIGTTGSCRQYCGGVLFSINADGSDYTILHRFGGTTAPDGTTPLWDSPTLVGTTLYGMTSGSNDYAFGTVYRYKMSLFTDGFETGDDSAWFYTTSRDKCAHAPEVLY